MVQVGNIYIKIIDFNTLYCYFFEPFAAPLVAVFVDEFAEVHRIRRVFHGNAVGKQPQFAVANEVVVKLGSGDEHFGLN